MSDRHVSKNKCRNAYPLYIPSISELKVTIHCARSQELLSRNYKLHISKNCFDKGFNQECIKYGLGGALENRDDPINHYNKSEHKCKRELKAFIKKEHYC